MPMHPDAQAVYSATWSPDAPNIHSGLALLTIRAKRLSSATDERADEANAIAAKLITDPAFVRAGRGINGAAHRCYVGAGLTDLAVRRG